MLKDLPRAPSLSGRVGEKDHDKAEQCERVHRGQSNNAAARRFPRHQGMARLGGRRRGRRAAGEACKRSTSNSRSPCAPPAEARNNGPGTRGAAEDQAPRRKGECVNARRGRGLAVLSPFRGQRLGLLQDVQDCRILEVGGYPYFRVGASRVAGCLLARFLDASSPLTRCS